MFIAASAARRSTVKPMPCALIFPSFISSGIFKMNFPKVTILKNGYLNPGSMWAAFPQFGNSYAVLIRLRFSQFSITRENNKAYDHLVNPLFLQIFFIVRKLTTTLALEMIITLNKSIFPCNCLTLTLKFQMSAAQVITFILNMHHLS